MSNLAQGRALKGISELSPILAADLRDLPLIRHLKLPTVFPGLLAGRGEGPVTGLAFPFARHSPGRGVALGPARPRRRLSRTSARNGPPLCGCRCAPLRPKWACRGRLRPMQLWPFPYRNFIAPCLSTGPDLDPLGYDICGALLARVRRRLEVLTGGVLTLQEAGCPPNLWRSSCPVAAA